MKWLRELYLHGCYLENNLSFYFSPNTHLLGEALALHALGLFFADSEEPPAGNISARSIMREQMERQVHADGSHIEQSTYYHLYATDMFCCTRFWRNRTVRTWTSWKRMADYLHAVMGPARGAAVSRRRRWRPIVSSVWTARSVRPRHHGDGQQRPGSA